MKKYLLLPLLFVILYSCGKDKPAEPQYQYSTWTVNNTETFSSNNMDVGRGNGRSSFKCLDPENWVAVIFWLPYFPQSGTWFLSINREAQNVDSVTMAFNYHSKPYAISLNDRNPIEASSANNKAKYKLAPTWFININDPSDSILIEGVFNEP